MNENRKTPYYVINRKGEVIARVIGGRGITRYLQELDAPAVGNGNHRINSGDIFDKIGADNYTQKGE